MSMPMEKNGVSNGVDLIIKEIDKAAGMPVE